MSHRPLTNTSSLKIAAAYCTVYSKIHLVGGFCVSFVHSTE
jgi:hypothetical protein